jgi:hypothetical protein
MALAHLAGVFTADGVNLATMGAYVREKFRRGRRMGINDEGFGNATAG